MVKISASQSWGPQFDSRPGWGLNIWVTFFPTKVHSAFHPSRGAYICFRSAGGKLIIVKRLWACYMEKALYKCTTLLLKPFSSHRDLPPVDMLGIFKTIFLLPWPAPAGRHVGHLQNHFPITVTSPRRPTCWTSSKPFSYYRDLPPPADMLDIFKTIFLLPWPPPRRPTCWTSSKPFSYYRDLPPPADMLDIFKTIFLLPWPAPGRHFGHLQNHFLITVTCPRPTCWASSKPFSNYRNLPPADMLDIFKTIFLLPWPAPAGRHVGHLQNHFPVTVTCPRPTCWKNTSQSHKLVQSSTNLQQTRVLRNQAYLTLFFLSPLWKVSRVKILVEKG